MNGKKKSQRARSRREGRDRRGSDGRRGQFVLCFSRCYLSLGGGEKRGRTAQHRAFTGSQHSGVARAFALSVSLRTYTHQKNNGPTEVDSPSLACIRPRNVGNCCNPAAEVIVTLFKRRLASIARERTAALPLASWLNPSLGRSRKGKESARVFSGIMSSPSRRESLRESSWPPAASSLLLLLLLPLLLDTAAAFFPRAHTSRLSLVACINLG